MATATPLTHPNARQQTMGNFPHEATFKRTTSTGTQETFLVSPCAYGAGLGGAPEMFEVEGGATDRILLPDWQPDVSPKQLVVLKFASGATRRFVVADAVPDGNGPDRTLVGVTPK